MSQSRRIRDLLHVLGCYWFSNAFKIAVFHILILKKSSQNEGLLVCFRRLFVL